jgi:hypothetical protein
MTVWVNNHESIPNVIFDIDVLYTSEGHDILKFLVFEGFVIFVFNDFLWFLYVMLNIKKI